MKYSLNASIIIPNYNRANALIQTLSALSEQNVSPSSFEVIVVDDGSTDGSVARVRDMVLPFTLKILEQSNQGPGAARNRGTEIAESDLLVFLDADMIPAPDLLKGYMAMFNQYPRAIIIGRQTPWPKAYTKRFIQIYSSSLASDLGPISSEVEFHALASGNFGVDRQSFQALQGFDENLWMNEDVDLGFRASKAGIKILYNPTCKGFHNHPKSPDQIFSQIQKSAWWTASMIKKHPEMSGQIPVYRIIDPICWRNDPFNLIVGKVLTRLISKPFFLTLLKMMLTFLERISSNIRLIRYIRFKIEAGYRYIGFHEYFK